MVASCLDPNPDRRPSMDMILNSPAVQSRMHLVPKDGVVSVLEVLNVF